MRPLSSVLPDASNVTGSPATTLLDEIVTSAFGAVSVGEASRWWTCVTFSSFVITMPGVGTTSSSVFPSEPVSAKVTKVEPRTSPRMIDTNNGERGRRIGYSLPGRGSSAGIRLCVHHYFARAHGRPSTNGTWPKPETSARKRPHLEALHASPTMRAVNDYLRAVVGR
ncbi:MAG TPA: hypothetical protein VI076_04415 [Actinopolymorphaceae bacterium]